MKEKEYNTYYSPWYEPQWRSFSLRIPIWCVSFLNVQVGSALVNKSAELSLDHTWISLTSPVFFSCFLKTRVCMDKTWVFAVDHSKLLSNISRLNILIDNIDWAWYHELVISGRKPMFWCIFSTRIYIDHMHQCLVHHSLIFLYYHQPYSNLIDPCWVIDLVYTCP